MSDYKQRREPASRQTHPKGTDNIQRGLHDRRPITDVGHGPAARVNATGQFGYQIGAFVAGRFFAAWTFGSRTAKLNRARPASGQLVWPLDSGCREGGGTVHLKPNFPHLYGWPV
jgi:hypothetical protein